MPEIEGATALPAGMIFAATTNGGQDDDTSKTSWDRGKAGRDPTVVD